MKRSISIIDHVGAKAGMDDYSRLLAEGFVANGIECILISNFKTQTEGIKSYRCFAGHLSNPVFKAINHFLGFFLAAICCRWSGCKQAVVHVFSFGAKDLFSMLILRFMGIRIVAIVHDVENLASGKQNRFSKKMMQWSKKIIVHNRFSYEELLKMNGFEFREKTFIIPHGHFHSLPSKISRAEARRQLMLESGITYLLFFGQIKEVKGLDILLRAMPSIPSQVKLIIAGKPWKTDFNNYEKLIRELNIEDRIIRKIRFITDAERDLLFTACDMLVLPYRQIFQSGVLLMAISYKLPLIASNLPANKETITDRENGLLFLSENPEDLTRQIITAISSTEKLQGFAENAWKKLSAENDWKNIAKAFLTL